MAGFRFDDVELYPEGFRVLKAGRVVHLEPKAFELLLFLVRHPGELLAKSQIQDAVWPDAFVSENALTRLVAQVRRELGDDAREARYIETVPTRGYRFLPAVEEVGEALPSTVPVASRATLRSPERWVAVGLMGLAVVSGLAVLWGRGTVTRTSVAQAPVQRTVEPGFRAGADFSPDGSQLVYSSDSAGTLQLVVRSVEGGQELQLTSGPGPKIEPAWSPDGRWIAYRDLAIGGLWLVPPTGGPPRQLTEFGSQPAWFPDGRRLVFSHPERPIFGAWEWPASYTSALWTVDLDSAEVRPFTTVDPEVGGQGMPAVSRDGRWVYYATGRFSGGGALWRVAAAGGPPECLTPWSVDDGEGSGRWRDQWLDPMPTPDGSALLAINVSTSSRIVRVEPGEGRAVLPVLAPAPDGTSHLRLSRSGRALVFTVLQGRTSIEEVELDAGGAVSGAPRTVSAPATKRVLRPLYSPDGERLAIQLWRSGADREIVVVDRGTGESESLRSPSGEVVWTGPRTLVAGAPGKPVELDVITRRVRSLPTPPAASDLLEVAFPRTVGIDAGLREMIFTAQGVAGGRELHLGDLMTGRQTRLTSFGRLVDFPFLSRTGLWVGFQVSDGDGAANELWRQPTGGGDPQRFQTAAGPSWGGAFSADGDSVAYAAHRSGSWFLARAGVHLPERVLDVPPETVGYLRWPDWSPDGRHIAYERMHFEGSLWTIELR